MNILPRFAIEDDDLDLLGRFTTWMERVVSHAAIDYLRRQGHRKWEDSLEQSEPDEVSYIDPDPKSAEDFDLAEGNLSDAFSNLTLLRRRILTLTLLERLPACEAAYKLGCSVEYVYKQKHKALKALRDQLMEESQHGK